VKRIDETAPAPTDLADDPAEIPGNWNGERAFRHPSRRGRRLGLRHGHPRMGKPAKRTLIRHALFAAPLAVGVLTIPMIETAFRALLVAAVRLVAFLAARFLSATRAAVPLSAITMTAQIENSEARGEAANSLTENSWAGSGHRSPEAELDNRRRSWQDDSHTDLEVLDLGPPNK